MNSDYREYTPNDDEDYNDNQEEELLEETEEVNSDDEIIEDPIEETTEEPIPEEDDYLTRWAQDIKTRQQPIEDIPEKLMRHVSNSQLAQDVIYWKEKGYSDDQILAGMVKMASQNTPKAQMPQNEYDEQQPEQQINIRQIIAEEIQKAVNPIGSKVQAMESQQYVNTVSNYNDNMLKQTLTKFGITESLNEQDLGNMRIVLGTALGRLNIQKDYMTQAEAEILVEKALSHKMKKSRQPVNRNSIQQKSIPQIAGGNTRTTTGIDTGQPKRDGLTRRERMESIFNKLGY